MSKRANQDPIAPETKRSRVEGHAAECSDKLCQGCDVGEIEISFKQGGDPSAEELLALALQEAGNDHDNDSDDENNGVARRLFDMAIEKYQKDEPENRIGYATCLVELGKAIAVQESISEGLEILRGELKKNNSEDVLLKLAGAAIALAVSIRKEQDAHFEKQEKELDADDEVALGELLEKQKVSKKETGLYSEAIEHTKDAFSRLGNDEALLKQAQSVLHEMRTYGLLLTQPFHKEHSNIVLDSVIDLTKQLPAYKEDDENLLLIAACLLHEERFVEDAKKKEALFKEIDNLLVESNKLHVKKHEKENHFVWEMHAMLRINQSNLADDDQALELYDEAIESFKKAHALDPDNEKIAGMIAMFEALQEAEAGEEYDEEEEEDDEGDQE